MSFRERTFDRASKPKAFAGLGNRLPASPNTGVQRAPAAVPAIQRQHLAATSVGPASSRTTGVIQRVNDPEKEARKKALQQQANDALKRVRERVKNKRKSYEKDPEFPRDKLWRLNAGENCLGKRFLFETEGGTDNPLEIDLGDTRDGFRLIDIVPAAINSDSGLMKVTYEHQGRTNILIHIVPARR
jgi:hypothetical protein